MTEKNIEGKFPHTDHKSAAGHYSGSNKVRDLYPNIGKLAADIGVIKVLPYLPPNLSALAYKSELTHRC